MGVQINEIDFTIRPKIFSLLIFFLLLANTLLARKFFKEINETEIDLTIPPSRIFKATAYDFPTLALIILPQVYRKIDLIHGDGGVGTIMISHLQEGISSVDTLKERVEARDEEKLFYSITIIQGRFPIGVEKIQIDNTYTNGAGTVIKRKTYFYTSCDTTIDETEIAAFNERAVGLFKAFEAYLVANPDA